MSRQKKSVKTEAIWTTSIEGGPFREHAKQSPRQTPHWSMKQARQTPCWTTKQEIDPTLDHRTSETDPTLGHRTSKRDPHAGAQNKQDRPPHWTTEQARQTPRWTMEQAASVMGTSTQNVISDHSRVKWEINSNKMLGGKKSPNTWKLRNILLKNPWTVEQITGEILK